MNKKVKSKRQFYKKYIDLKIYRTTRLRSFLTIGMFAIVIYDSFIHGLPFHYILFTLLGTLAGKKSADLNVMKNKSELNHAKE